jgi:hypothetical protein
MVPDAAKGSAKAVIDGVVVTKQFSYAGRF